jgi:outer membrane protein assembly factor BamA
VKPVSWLNVGTQVGYMSPEIGAGADDRYPSLEQIFSDLEAAGLVEQPNFLHTTFFAEIDTLDASGHPRQGGFYRASFGFWDDRTLERFDHKRFDVQAMHFVPFDESKNHVVSGRIGTSYVNNVTGERVPFYFLPYVGGRDTVRSLREFRFKDENAVWIGAEYNYRPTKWVSVATFVDAGEVAPDWNDIDFRGMKAGYGVGLRVHSRTQTFARLDVGTGGGEGWQWFIKLGPSF